MTPLKRAFLALEDAEARLAAQERAVHEPIAIIGLGCRVPGGGDDADSFWRLMHDGVDTITPVPADRWDHTAFYNPDPDAPGGIATHSGGFLRAIDQFDAGLFGIAPREAEGMDPQQRLLLEVTWEALEHAGQAPDRLQDSITGIYVGACSSDYAYLQLKSGDPALLDAHFTSGIAHSVFSGRLSYLLGLRGPSLTIDTACSSSLVAIHLACQALRNAECRMAIAGGVNLMLAPDLFVALSHSRMLSPDGRCKTFDASADGFARGEGCGVVILKRLSDAQNDADHILAVIRGSAVNQDGPSSSLTAPNGPAQEAVIREALTFAGLLPRQVGFIEAHGTGTQLGDPLEVKALGAVFGADRDRHQPLLIGSVKTNVGHLEAAAGVAGLIKIILSLQHKIIPPHLHFTTPTPHIAWSDLPFRVPRRAVPWQPIGGRRIGGVSAFGFSGTNAHVVVEEAPSDTVARTAEAKRSCLFALSAREPKALAELAGRHAAALTRLSNDTLADICHTANTGRAHFNERATIIAETPDELRSGLDSLARGKAARGVIQAHVTRRDPPRIAFLFTGQGSQYGGMARGLYDASVVFRAALDRCAEILRPHLDQPLLDVLFAQDASATLLDRTVYTQPALFAVEYALTELWRSWGVTPIAAIGHSVGEYVAACVAGLFSLEDGLRLIALRGRLMQSLPAGGAMAAVFAPEALVAKILAPYAASLSIAAVNGPLQAVISGAAGAVAAACRVFQEQGVRQQMLTVSHAFHSPLVDPVLDRFEQEVQAVRFAKPRIRLISNVTGRLAVADEIARPSYWRRHMRAAVRFSDGLRALESAQPDCCIEIGPHPTLLSFATTALTASPPKMIASLRRGKPDWQQMLEGLSTVYLAGAQVNWRGFNEAGTRRIVDLPTYPFQHERYWFRARLKNERHAATMAVGTHPLLGPRLRSAVQGTIYESRISADAPAFVRQHRVLGRVALPAAAYLEMLMAGARDVLGTDLVRIEDVAISEAMLLEDDGAERIVQTVFEPVRSGSTAVSISSIAVTAADTMPWGRHVTGRASIASPAPQTPDLLAGLQAQCPTPVAAQALYDDFEARGMQFGADFHGVRQIWCGQAKTTRHAVGEIVLSPAVADASCYGLHPLLLDGCLQLIAAVMPADAGTNSLYLPVGIGSYTLFRPADGRCWSHVTVQSVSGGVCRADIRVINAEGTLIAELRRMQFKQVSRDALERISERWLDECLYETVWRPAPPTSARPHAGRMATGLMDIASSPLAAISGPAVPGQVARDWLLFADQGGVAAGLAERLTARGDHCTIVEPGRFACDPARYRIDPAAADDYRRLLAGLHAAGRSVSGVVHAWALDSEPWNSLSKEQLVEAQTRSAVTPMLLAQALVAQSVPPRLWIITRGGQYAGAAERSASPIQAAAWGVGRTLAIEHPEIQSVCIDLDTTSSATDLDALVAELHEDGTEQQTAWRAGERWVARLTRARRIWPSVADPSAEVAWRMTPALLGTFDEFRREPAERRPPMADEVEIAVQATGLNFKDALNVLGMVPGASNAPLGIECAGVVTRIGSSVAHVSPGDAVLAIAPGCFASFALAKSDLVQRRPEGMSAEEGAAFAVPFMTAAFCLTHAAGVRAGDRVLIHAAAGGVGMAAVQLAQRAGAEVFATAGSPWKRALLHSMGIRHVFDSRSSSFVADIMASSGGHGMDVVLNSLAGELLDASFRVAARGCRFIEIGSRGVKSHEWVAALGRDIRYTLADWSPILQSDPALMGGILAQLMAQLRAGTLTPLPRQVFAAEDAPSAFRLMAQARHVGKVVVRNGRATPAAIRRDGTYLVTGGLSGLGLLVARWLTRRGAGRLVLIGRRGVTPEASDVLDELRAGGTHVIAEAMDVTDEIALQALLSRIRSDGPPLRGVVHSAAVLDDASLLQQDAQRFARVFEPKVHGAWLLDRLTRGDPLDLFVMFSSIAAVLGAAGQANYAAANAVLDLLAHDRRIRGLCGLSVNWGAWTDIGMTADRQLTDRLAAQGFGAMTPAQGILALERLLEEGGSTQVAVLPVDWRRFLDRSGYGSGQALLAELAGATVDARSIAAEPAARDPSLREALAAAPATRRRQVVATFVRRHALGTLGMDQAKEIDPAIPLGEIGLDSLLAVQLRNTLGLALGHSLPVTLLFDYPTVDALTDFLLTDVLADDASGPENAVRSVSGHSAIKDTGKGSGAVRDLVAPLFNTEAASIDFVAGLSDDEVDRLLAARGAQEV
jgi:acyl transferase domain-containing protein/NADPH:quinone reductase-like Zn-dependent oxidoreductase